MPDVDPRRRPPTSRDPWTEAGLVLLALIWGVNFSVIKIALEELSPLAFNALRFPVACVVLALLLGVTKRITWPERRDWPRIVALGLIGHVGYQLLFIFGLRSTSAGNASLLLATSPVWTLLLSFASGHERPRALVWAGVIGTTIGMGLVVGAGPGFRFGSETLVGDVLMMLSALLWATYTVGARDLVHRYGPLQMTAWTLWIGSVALVLMGIPSLRETEFRALSTMSWVGIGYAGALAISVAYALWYRGVHRIGNTRTAAFSNLVPVVALSVAWVWLGERPAGWQLVGAVFVLGSLSLTRSRPSTGR